MRTAVLPAAGLTLALALTGCSAHAAGIVAAPRPTLTAPVPSPTLAEAPAAVLPTTLPASPTTAPSPTVPALPSYDVKAVQRQLTGLHYYVAAIDGQPGPALSSAVMAFQKVQGIGADGVVGPATLAALKAPRTPALKGVSPADRIEVDLTRQVLYLVRGGAIVRIMPVSSGNGATYVQKDGSTARSLTPVGYYRIERRYRGPQVADLGTLYDPEYFYLGWAIHGSDSVPPYPASHGCIRLTRTDATYLFAAIGVGTSVYVYGGSYTFVAGSSAPGTDTPTGDTPAGAPHPSAPASPTPSSASPTATASPSATTSPTAAPTPSPSPTASP